VGGSGYFDGTGDYLSVANQTALQLSGSQFTIEGWFYFTTSGVDNYIVVQSSALADANVNWLVRVTSGNKLRVLLMTSGATAVSFDGSTTVTANSWHHFAATCDGTGAGSNVRSWLDGVYQGGTTVNTANINTNTAATQIGGWSFASSYSTGYVSGLRILKGTALYTGTSDITVPTSPPTAITNTSLLLNFTNAGVVDATAKNVLETVGTAQISSTTSKFPPTSIYLSGDGNYLTSRSSPVFSLNGDFTMEAWVYPINAGRSADAEKYGTIVSCAAVGVANPEFSWFIRIVGGVVTEYFLNLNFTTVLQVTGLSVSLNAWHYFAVTRSGTGTGNLKLYIDGTLVGTSSGAVTQSATFTSAQTLMVGRNAGSTAYQNWLSGYFQDVRITPGYVRTVTTIPTAPFPVQ
jgi:hypothetical protein